MQFDSVTPHPPEGRVGSEAVELGECLQASLSHQVGDGVVPACAARHSRVHSNGPDEMRSWLIIIIIMSKYRVSHIIGPTLFFCNFSGSGAPTEELFTIFQQPWKFATL